MNKTIWIINQYASTPETGMGGRHYYLAKNLVKLGYRVYVIASAYTHLLKKSKEFDGKFLTEEVDGIKFVWVSMPKYRDAHDKKRVYNWFLFSWRLLGLPKIIQDKPDVVIASSPSLVVSLAASRLAKKYHAKFGFEVRDIWPLTFVELGGYSPKHPFIKLMQYIEDKAYKDADIVFSNLPNAVEHMVSRGMDRKKFRWIPNGFDMEEVCSQAPLKQDIIAKIPKDKFIVGYTGTFGVANALDYFIEAAKIMQDKDDEVAFVLVGKGKEEERLKQLASGLNNFIFIDPIDKKEVQSMLSLFDVCYIGWNNEKIYKFGIAANKIPEYMFASKPILHSYNGSYDTVVMADCGINVSAEDTDAIVKGILELKNMTQKERKKMGENGKKYALEHHDYEKLALKMANEIFV